MYISLKCWNTKRLKCSYGMNLGHSGTVGSKPGHAGAGQLNCFAVECLLSLTHPLFILSNYFLLTKVSEAPTTVHTQLSSTV